MAQQAESSGWDVATKLEHSHGGVPCVATAEIRRLQAENEALRTALAQQGEQPDQRLVNLLCRIHRDGGHYIAKHGIDKAVIDADVRVAQLNALTDTAAPAPQTAQDVTELVEALEDLIESTTGVDQGWQPISTAPKDGSFYLAFGGGKMWTQNQPNGCYPGEWYFSESRGEWRGCVISKEATHWIPLQAAPKEQQQ